MDVTEHQIFGGPFRIEADGYRVVCLRGGRHSKPVPAGWAVLDIHLGTSEGRTVISDDPAAPTLMPARCFNVIPPGKDYAIDVLRAGNSVVFLFEPSAIHIPPARQILSQIDKPLWHQTDSAMISVGEIVFNFMTTVQHEVDRRETKFIRDLFSVRLLQLLSSEASEQAPRNPVQRAIEFIEENYRSETSYNAVAAAAGLSPYSLARRFRTSTGISMRHYIIRRRIQHAISLIMETERSLADIAFACGFSSQSHMSTAFRKHTGRTPKSYRLVELKQKKGKQSE